MKFTAVLSGQYLVEVNGVVVSTHTTEREALESAVNRELAKPGDVVTYRHDYVVRVESSAPSSQTLSGMALAMNA